MGAMFKTQAIILAMLALCATSLTARDLPPGEKTGEVEWGIYIDPDGCMHWWADGGFEGYMVPRLTRSGRPMCLRSRTCLVGDTDTFFATDSADLTPMALERLERLFKKRNIFSYSSKGHTDDRASRAYNQDLSERRAKAVADFGRSLGAVIEHEAGFGEDQPIASNKTAAGQRKNRRVEIVCFQQ